MKIYSGPGKFVNEFNQDFWAQVLPSIKLRICEFTLPQVCLFFLLAEILMVDFLGKEFFLRKFGNCRNSEIQELIRNSY